MPCFDDEIVPWRMKQMKREFIYHPVKTKDIERMVLQTKNRYLGVNMRIYNRIKDQFIFHEKLIPVKYIRQIYCLTPKK